MPINHGTNHSVTYIYFIFCMILL